VSGSQQEHVIAARAHRSKSTYSTVFGLRRTCRLLFSETPKDLRRASSRRLTRTQNRSRNNVLLFALTVELAWHTSQSRIQTLAQDNTRRGTITSRGCRDKVLVYPSRSTSRMGMRSRVYCIKIILLLAVWQRVPFACRGSEDTATPTAVCSVDTARYLQGHLRVRDKGTRHTQRQQGTRRTPHCEIGR